MKIELCNLIGMALFSIDRTYNQAGQQTDTIRFNEMNLSNGFYSLKLNVNGVNTVKRFINEIMKF